MSGVFRVLQDGECVAWRWTTAWTALCYRVVWEQQARNTRRNVAKGPLPTSLPCLTKLRSRNSRRFALIKLLLFYVPVLSPSPAQAFNMIDQNRDGFIDSEDLKDMLASLGRLPSYVLWSVSLFSWIGQEPSDSVVDGMMSEAPGPLNFTMFLTLFGEKLTGQPRGCQKLLLRQGLLNGGQNC